MKTLFFCLLFWPGLLMAGEPELLLAQTYEGGIRVSDYWASEKLDGVRAYWDGRQLISRQGNVFDAPAWFTAGFPRQALDGELWIGRGQFEVVASAVQKQQAVDSEWRRVGYWVFELPHGEGSFSERLLRLQALVDNAGSPYLHRVEQFTLADNAALQQKLEAVVKAGGEGLMLHLKSAPYTTGRSDVLLKVKQWQDAEAKVIAHLPGKGKYRGMLGALLVELPDGTQFKIGSGFSDVQRANPPPVGSIITYKYYGLTANGIPRFASFMRIRH